MWWCLLLVLGGIALVAALVFWSYKRQEANEYDQTGPLMLKLGLSGVLVCIVAGLFSMGAFGGFLAIAPLFVLGLLWAGPLMDWLGGGAIASLLGGGQEVEPEPMYSIAETKRLRGNPTGAIDEINKELAKFPGDCRGLMLKAEIQMLDLSDFAEASATLRLIIDHRPQEIEGAFHYQPGQISRALGALAEWQEKFAKDEEAARRTLLDLRDRFPGTLIELQTAQKLARKDFYLEMNDKRDITLLVSECLKQLEQHPMDNDTREKLARLYFTRYDKPDLAWEEMNKLFEHPYQQPADLSRWLNLMADWHLEKNNPDGARACLQQVISRFPGLPHKEEAEARLERMKSKYPIT